MNGNFAFAIVFGLLLGARGLFYAGQKLHRFLNSDAYRARVAARRRLAAGLDALQEGECVTLTGVVRALGELVEAPLSGREGVVAVATADVVLPNARQRARPTFVDEIRQVTMRPFVLETAQGPIIVDAREADVDLPASPIIPRRREREQAFLLGHDFDLAKVEGRAFLEVLVAPGDRISVAGVVAIARDTSVEHGYRDAPTKMRLVADEKFPLSIGKPR